MGTAMNNENTVQFQDGVIERATQLMSKAELEEKIADLALRMNSELKEPQHMLCVLTGGIVFAGKLMDYLTMPLTLDYVHATRYRGETSGDEVEWIVTPKQSMEGQEVLIVDDIYDVGTTIKAIIDACYQQGAKKVRTVVMVDKVHDRKAYPELAMDFVACEMPDQYLFGSGMDYRHLLRNAPGIYAASEQDQ